ncbi:MAG: mechanosensitive ion channel family protein [Oligoflexia bacterium]|nr:mechanosensitive ion channel family protein [Oligoflexia bacterium]
MLNTLHAFLNKNFSSIIILLIFLIIGLFIFSLVLNRIQNNIKTMPVILRALIPVLTNAKIKQLLIFTVFYISILEFPWPGNALKYIKIIGLIFFSLYTAILVQEIIKFIFNVYLFGAEENNLRLKGYKSILGLIIVIIWSLFTIFLLDNLGLKISSVIAGFGIGGVAIALASQTFLGDLFSYFAIIFDHPFNIGDFIIVDNYMGTVETIGVKTTKIRSLSGEQLIFSNTDLMKSRIQNYKRMDNRRVLFKINVTYSTPLEKLRLIPQTIKDIIIAIPQTQFDRAHLSAFAELSIQFEIVYYVLSSDYNLFMDIQQEVYLKLHQEFSSKNIEFAFLSQHLRNENFVTLRS